MLEDVKQRLGFGFFSFFFFFFLFFFQTDVSTGVFIPLKVKDSSFMRLLLVIRKRINWHGRNGTRQDQRKGQGQ